MPRFHAQHLLSSPKEEQLLPPGEQEWGEDPYTNPYYNSVSTLLSWKAASRPYRKKNRSFWTTAIILLALVILILFLSGQRLLIGVLFALAFLIYVLDHVPPDEIEYKLSTQGITIGDHFYHWQELDSFWFSKKDGYNMLNVLTRFRFPGLLIIVMGDTPEDEIKSVVARYLPFHEIAPKSMMEKWTESLQKHFPLENPHS